MPKPKSKNNPKPIRITCDDTTYSCLHKNGKVTVRTTRTAKGQYIVAGVYDIINDAWHNDHGDAPLPTRVKRIIADYFS